MRAWTIRSFDGIEGLTLEDVPDPHPQEGEVVVSLKLAALNPADRYLSEGQYPARPALPHILGRDGIGVASEVGPGVREIRAGDPVLILRSEIGVSRAGTFSERVSVPVESLVPVPAGWSDEQAAAAPLVYLTAHQALTQWPDLPAGAVVLVTGASGGVGVAAVQLGKSSGQTVIALSRSEKKQQRLRSLGAAAAFDPNNPQWRTRAKEFLAGRRVDLVIDNIGGNLLPETIDLLGMHGRVSVVGRLAGPVPQFNTASLFFRRIRMGGVAVGTFTPAESRAAWNAIVQRLDASGARPVIDHVFAFEQLPEAFARLAEGPMGKVLLDIAGAT
jgi:NADPH2:quinone reductase